MSTVATFADLPAVPAVYALYSGKGRSRDVVYVGISKNLKSRLGQHFIRREAQQPTCPIVPQDDTLFAVDHADAVSGA